MKLSRLVQFLDPAVIVHLDQETVSVAELRGQLAAGAWSGADPWLALHAQQHTLDLYDIQRPAWQRHCGWLALDIADRSPGRPL